MTLVSLAVDDDQGVICHIGTILVPVVEGDVHQRMDEWWATWREQVPHPDADSDFIEWLLVSVHGCQRADQPTLHVFGR